MNTNAERLRKEAAYEALFQKNQEQQKQRREANAAKLAAKLQQEEEQRKMEEKRKANLRNTAMRAPRFRPSEMNEMNVPPLEGGKRKTRKHKRRHSRKRRTYRH